MCRPSSWERPARRGAIRALSLQNRLTQFASHLSVQYTLDVLFSCVFSRTFDDSYAFLVKSLPYTRLPGTDEG